MCQTAGFGCICWISYNFKQKQQHPVMVAHTSNPSAQKRKEGGQELRVLLSHTARSRTKQKGLSKKGDKCGWLG